MINGKDSVTVDDVKAVAFDVLNHRLMVRDVVEGEDSKDYGIQKIQDILAISMENIK